MTRLFIRHKPVEGLVTHTLTPGRFVIRTSVLTSAGLDVSPSSLDVAYVCVVHEGNCWATRSFLRDNGSSLARLICVPFNDDPSGQEMILADMILN